ncbi:MAG: DUF5915 domain-containing protein [Owenweeksia sp.]|nr:DUF5915 domain-containing protein [Owenweeksia sp.]
MQEFVNEELSNWYVRLCRRRFWKGDMSTDKQMAYETLYACLLDLSQLISPVAPFFADWFYQNLTAPQALDTKKQSVHLTEFEAEKPHLVDVTLNQRMKMAQSLSSMVLALRKKEKIKVRQPLQKMMVPALKPEVVELIESVQDIVLSEVNVKELDILRDVSGVLVKKIKPDFKKLGPRYGKQMKEIASVINQFTQEDIAQLEQKGSYELEINGKPTTLNLNDVEINTEDIPGWLVMTEGDRTVALDITIDDNLRYEGIARELVNRIQNLRKDKGLEVTDHISLKVLKNDTLEEALKRNKKYIADETLARDLELHDSLDAGQAVDFDGITTKISLEKV